MIWIKLLATLYVIHTPAQPPIPVMECEAVAVGVVTICESYTYVYVARRGAVGERCLAITHPYDRQELYVDHASGESRLFYRDYAHNCYRLVRCKGMPVYCSWAKWPDMSRQVLIGLPPPRLKDRLGEIKHAIIYGAALGCSYSSKARSTPPPLPF